MRRGLRQLGVVALAALKIAGSSVYEQWQSS